MKKIDMRKIKSVPIGWFLNKIQEICSLEYGKAQPNDISSDGKYPVVGTGGVIAYSNSFVYNKTSIIVGRKGSIDKIYFMQEPFWPIDTTFYSLMKNGNNVKWFYHYLNLYPLLSLNEATGVTSLSRENLYRVNILVPPLSEQKEIANYLDQNDSLIELHEKLLDKKLLLKKALMQQLLTGKKRFKEFRKSNKYHKTKFHSYPNDWEMIPVSKIAKQVVLLNQKNKDLVVLSCTKYDGLVDSLKYFGRRIYSEDTSTYKLVRRNQFAYATNHVEEGSIGLLTAYDEALISPMYTVFEVNEKVDVEFLFKLFKTETYRHIFEINTSGSINRRGGLRWSDFSKIKIPLPTLGEQKSIAQFFNNIDRELNLLNSKLEHLKLQKKGLMQKLLTGKIRVKI